MKLREKRHEPLLQYIFRNYPVPHIAYAHGKIPGCQKFIHLPLGSPVAVKALAYELNGFVFTHGYSTRPEKLPTFKMQLRSVTLHRSIFSPKISNFPELLVIFVSNVRGMA